MLLVLWYNQLCYEDGVEHITNYAGRCQHWWSLLIIATVMDVARNLVLLICLLELVK